MTSAERVRLLRTLRCIITGAPDLKRWSADSSLEQSWDERTRIIAGLVPAGSRVVEFGAGRRVLEQYLDPSCHYVPSDVVSRGSGTLVCDLNTRPLPDLSSLRPNVAVFAGVLEYINRPRAIPPWLSRHVGLCIASYECSRTARGRPGRLRERWTRARTGWVNTFNEPELLALFAGSGFVCRDKVVWHTVDGDEPIFAFQRREGTR